MSRAAVPRRCATPSACPTATSACSSTAPDRACEPRSRGTSMRDSHQHVTCSDVVELVTDYLERSLPADEATLVEQHLNFCEGCVWYVDQIRTTVATVGRIE